MKEINIIGNKYGRLTVTGRSTIVRSDKAHLYECLCDCGKTCNVIKKHLTNTNGRCTRSCGCIGKETVGNKSSRWGGYEELSGKFLGSILRGSHGGREIEMSVTPEYIWKLFLKQERKCALSGVVLILPKDSFDKSKTASLDRINSSIGYIEGNVQWVHKDVNIMKNQFDQNYFIDLCRKIVDNNKVTG